MRISDWSSDVCSSDLRAITAICARRDRLMQKMPISPLLPGGRLTMALFRHTISPRTEPDPAHSLGELTMTGPREPRSTLTGWVLAIIQAMRTQGAEAEAVLTEIGLVQARQAGGSRHYSQATVSKPWNHSNESPSDPPLGIKVRADKDPATLPVSC